MKKMHRNAYKGKQALITTTEQPEQVRTVPFYPPTLFLPKWIEDGKPDLVYPGGPYFDFPGEEKKSPVTLYIDIRVYRELQVVWKWAEKNSGEISWFMPTHRINKMHKHWLAWGYFLTGQDASGGDVDTDGMDCARYYKHLSGVLDEGEQMPEYGVYKHSHVFNGKLHRCLSQGHKHPPGIRGWSGTDINQQTKSDDLGYYDNYRFYFLYTPPNHIKADLVVYEPVLYRCENVNIGLYVPEDGAPEITRKREKEIEAMCEALVKKKTYTAGRKITSVGTQPTQEISNFSFWDYGDRNYMPSPSDDYLTQMVDDTPRAEIDITEWLIDTLNKSLEAHCRSREFYNTDIDAKDAQIIDDAMGGVSLEMEHADGMCDLLENVMKVIKQRRLTKEFDYSASELLNSFVTRFEEELLNLQFNENGVIARSMQIMLDKYGNNKINAFTGKTGIDLFIENYLM